MKNATFLASCLVVGIGLVGLCGGLGIASAMSSRPSGGVHPARDRDQCFDPTFIRGFQTINDHKIIIISDRNQAYELTLGGVCIGLDTSFTIGVRSRMGASNVCGPFDADILYDDSMGRGRAQSCPITGMRHLTGEEAEPYIYSPRTKPNAGASSSAASGDNASKNW